MHRVLRGAGLTVRPGELVAVAGENGAGKSTLLRILAGTLAPDRGAVKLTGTLGYCPQEPVVNDNLTVGQHLRYFAAAARPWRSSPTWSSNSAGSTCWPTWPMAA